MTISNQTSSVTYTGNSVQTVFTYNFLIPYQTDGETPAVAVYIIEDDIPALLSPSDYTITGVGESAGGTVTYSPAIDATQQIQINRALLYTQPTQWINQGFYPHSIEQLADSLVMMIQQLAAAAGLTVTTQPPLESFSFALTDETTVIVSTGTYFTFDMPYDFNVEEVIGQLTTTSSSGNVTMDVKKAGTTILSTGITVEQGETSSLTAATQPVVSVPSLLKGSRMTFLLAGVGASATGAKVTLTGRQP